MASKIGRLFARRYSSRAPGAAPGDHGERAMRGYKIWENASLFIAIPAFIVTGVITFMGHHEHERPKFVPYDHLRIRTKPFPWGDGNHTLFHNPKTNALPDGYED